MTSGDLDVRGTISFSLAAALLVLVIGCSGESPGDTAQADSSRSRVPLYPLSAPPPDGQMGQTAQDAGDPFGGTTFAAASTSYGGTANYCPPEGCPETLPLTPTYPSPVVPLGDPPVIVNNTYQPGTAAFVPATSTPAPAVAVAERYRSPYDPLFERYGQYGYTTTYAQPYNPSLAATTTISYAVEPVATSYVSEPYTVTQTATYSAPVYDPNVNVYSAPATTTTTTTTTYSTGYAAGYDYTPSASMMAPVPATSQTTYYAATTTSPAPYTPMTTYTQPATTPVSFAPPAIDASAGQGGYRLVPALDVPPGNHPNDAGPSQWFEVIRPGNGPIRIGRVSSTCVCVGVRVPNRFVAAGERALIEARTLTRTPVRNVTYGVYVNIMEPEKMVLDADILIP